LVDLQKICAKYVLETWFLPDDDIRKCLLDMKYGRTKYALRDVNIMKWLKWWDLFPLSYLRTLMAHLCSQWTRNFQKKYFTFYWSIYRLFVINRGWNRDSLQIMILVYVCSRWGLVQLKTRFEKWIARNDVKGVGLFYLSYLITLMAYLCIQLSPNFQNKCFTFDWSISRLFVLNRGWNLVSLQIMIFVYVCSTWGLVQLKTRFEKWITRNDANGVGLFYLSYLITLMVYLCSQSTPNVQIKCFMFDWSMYRLFVLNRGWNRNSLQIMIFT
jgi:hypothetical protein